MDKKANLKKGVVMAALMVAIVAICFVFVQAAVDITASRDPVTINESTYTVINFTIANADTDSTENVTRLNITANTSTFTISYDNWTATNITNAINQTDNGTYWVTWENTTTPSIINYSTTNDFSINVSGSTPGTYRFTIMAWNTTWDTNDTNVTITVNDTTAPRVNATCGATSLSYGGSITVTCSCWDNVACESTTYTLSVTGPDGSSTVTGTTSGDAFTPNLGVGTYTASCTATGNDTTNNSISTTADTCNFTVSSAGGGGGGAPSKEPKDVMTWAKIEAGKEYTKEFVNTGIPELAITLKETASNIRIEITEPKETPDVTAPTNLLYKYLKIETRNLEDDNIESASLVFEVNNSWLADKDTSTITLNRYVGGNWVNLPTELVEKKASVTTFKATTSGFSYFAITGIAAKKTIAEVAKENWGLTIGLIVIIAIIAVAAYFFFYKKK